MSTCSAMCFLVSAQLQQAAQLAVQFQALCKLLHAVGEHDAHGHEVGEELQQLGVGQHAVLQAIVQ